MLVRDLPDDVVDRLKARARAHGRSLEAELRAILDEASRPAGQLRAAATELAAETTGTYATDTVELLREDRGR